MYIKSIATLILRHTHTNIYQHAHTYTYTNTGTMGPSHSFAQDEVHHGAHGIVKELGGRQEGGVGELYKREWGKREKGRDERKCINGKNEIA
jgi:hypothetical protein